MNSEIILCKNIKMDRDYNNVLNYTEANMLALCRANAVASASDYSFLRPTGNIFVGFTYDQCLQANYIAFQNKDYSNKWFFAWIDEVIWQGNKNCELRFTVDNFSTWFNKVTTQKCFITRQHVNDDTIGANIIEENLNIGEVVAETIEDYNKFSNFYIAVASTYEPSSSTYTINGNTYNGGSFSGVCLYNGQIFGQTIFLFDYEQLATIGVSMFIEQIIKEGHIEDIGALFIIPKNIFGENDLITHNGYYGETLPLVSYQYYVPVEKGTIVSDTKTINKTTSFSGVTVKNNKCYTYPYNYLYVTNNVGNDCIYRYEDFSTNDIKFDLEFAISIGCSGRLIPKNYKGATTNYNESLPVAKFPTCSWSGDAFINWLTQNGVNLATQMVNIGINSAVNTSNLVAGNLTGFTMGVLSISNNIANLIGQFYKASLLPSVVQGENNADINYIVNKNKFIFYHMRVKTQYLKLIDDYFTRYGYAIKSLETPNITGRTYWNFVEIGANEIIGYGEVPSKAMEDINNAFRKGVTIWHNHANIGNFNLNNTIVT